MTAYRTMLHDATRWSRASARLSIEGTPSLSGNVDVQGAKNTAQKVIPMCALVPGIHRLRRVPMIRDTLAVLEIMSYLGGGIYIDDGTVVIDTRDLVARPIPRELTVRATGTFHFAGALLGRFGFVDIAPPGGDDIGARPVDVHLELFRQLGAEVDCTGHSYAIRMRGNGASTLRMPIRSAGAFINCAQVAFASGRRVAIENGPIDSDTRAALDFLTLLGGVVGQSMDGPMAVTTIERTGDCPSGGGHFELPPDRNDAATWLLAAGVGRGHIVVCGFTPVELRLVLGFLGDLGAQIREGPNDVHVDCSRGLAADGYELIVGPSPEFHSDWGSLAQAVLSAAAGTSTVEDRMYEARYRHVDELNRLGADIRYVHRPVPRGSLMFDRAADQVVGLEIHGPRPLRGTAVVGRDVRGAATLALAAASASGTTLLAGVEQLGRGYERFPARLHGLGVTVEVLDT